MEFEEIERLAEMMDRYNMESLELERGEFRLSLGRNCGIPCAKQRCEEQVREYAPVQIGDMAADENGGESVASQTIHSPMIGSFYRSPAPGQPAFVEVGSQVNGDSVVCIIEAMKVLNEITADISGTVVEVLVQDGQAVEFGQPLFRIATGT
ncbi:MAG: acetyl-CoA carboxylase biotin carboxyl carrier protein [Puniceicoccales bacterium]|jgi:acetyl-CoA carboxylase biotin carboxyl carrier protein|nr:acetyl-CoA carboxylase biotin carboxyl carrier protein [Puniceicoccales bacterium]